MAENLKVTDLDIEQIRENLKDYLRGRPEFQDYDFDGAGLSFLIDLLAYNTHYNAFYTNMVGAEMFLDTAVLRESVVSLAKHIDYTPRSTRSAIAKIRVDFTPASNPPWIQIDKGTQFNGTGNDVYSFTTTKTEVVYPDINGNYFIEELELIEGERLTHRFPVDYRGTDAPRFIIPNDNVDTTSLNVEIYRSETSTQKTYYSLAEDLNELRGDDQVYWIQETEDGQFEIIFGDNIIGKRPEQDNVVSINYVISSGADANNASSFSAEDGIGGINPSEFSITLVAKAVGGYVKETIDSIKLLAPLTWETQNRAVTAQDYEVLIKKDYPDIEFVRAWGGEDNVPPQYGRVFIALKPTEGLILNNTQKEQIKRDIVKTKNVVSVEPVIVEPDFLHLIVESHVNMDSKITTKTPGDIQGDVLSTIQTYRDDELRGFDTDFRHSKLSGLIDDSDEAILNNSTSVTMKYKFTPPLNIPTDFTFELQNPIDSGDSANTISSVNSSAFMYKNAESYLADDGKGSLYIYRLFVDKRVIFKRDVGTVDYDKGTIKLVEFAPESIVSGLPTLDLIVTPKELDITTLRNQVFIIEDEDITVFVVDERTGTGTIGAL